MKYQFTKEYQHQGKHRTCDNPQEGLEKFSESKDIQIEEGNVVD